MTDDLPPLPALRLGHYRHYQGGEYGIAVLSRWPIAQQRTVTRFDARYINDPFRLSYQMRYLSDVLNDPGLCASE